MLDYAISTPDSELYILQPGLVIVEHVTLMIKQHLHNHITCLAALCIYNDMQKSETKKHLLSEFKEPDHLKSDFTHNLGVFWVYKPQKSVQNTV